MHGNVTSYDGEQGFVPISEEHMPTATPPRRRRVL